MYRWKICLGDCNKDYGFNGGIRELVLLHTAISEEEATKAKNLQFTYNPTFKAYFRFQDLGNKFKKDEFVDWSWV